VTTALVIGGSGLVGSQLLGQLLEDPNFGQVRALGRRGTGRSHPKLEDRVIDFDAPASWSALVVGDVVFSCLGTTRRQAGSQVAQRKVDHDYPFEVAKAARANGVATFVLVSSASANPRSRIFYSRIKGELDRDVQRLGFERVRILRPSLLTGDRPDSRAGEKIGARVLGLLNGLGIARRYRAIPAATVARAMIQVALDPAKGNCVYTLDEIFEEAERPR
jgi:uncharacterized protein YbjT (DUF2867 family)